MHIYSIIPYGRPSVAQAPRWFKGYFGFKLPFLFAFYLCVNNPQNKMSDHKRTAFLTYYILLFFYIYVCYFLCVNRSACQLNYGRSALKMLRIFGQASKPFFFILASLCFFSFLTTAIYFSRGLCARPHAF